MARYDENNLDDLEEVDLNADPSTQFGLNGRTWHVRNRDAVDQVAFSRAMQRDDIEGLLRAVIVPDEWDDMADLLAQPDVLSRSQAARLGEIITEALSNRPTRRSKTSGPGPQRTTRKSGAGSRSAATADV